MNIDFAMQLMHTKDRTDPCKTSILKGNSCKDFQSSTTQCSLLLRSEKIGQKTETLVKRLEHIKCISLSSPRPLTSPPRTKTRTLETTLEITKTPHFEVLNKRITYKFLINLTITFLNTRTKSKSSQQSGNHDWVKYILKWSGSSI